MERSKETDVATTSVLLSSQNTYLGQSKIYSSLTSLRFHIVWYSFPVSPVTTLPNLVLSFSVDENT